VSEPTLSFTVSKFSCDKCFTIAFHLRALITPHVIPSDGVLQSNIYRISCFVQVFVFQLVSVLGNRALRGIFVPMRDEVTREWRKLHNEELNDMYCSPNIVRVIT